MGAQFDPVRAPSRGGERGFDGVDAGFDEDALAHSYIRAVSAFASSTRKPPIFSLTASTYFRPFSAVAAAGRPTPVAGTPRPPPRRRHQSTGRRDRNSPRLNSSH